MGHTNSSFAGTGIIDRVSKFASPNLETYKPFCNNKECVKVPS